MEEHQIVPDIIDRSPKETLIVQFDNKIELKLGNLCTIEQVKSKPIQLAWPASPNKFYTLCFIDPDAPSRTNREFGEWLHWLVVNIPGQDWNSGNILAEFVPSCPGENSGVHRYTFLIYEQPSKIQCDSERRLTTAVDDRPFRRKFSARNFAQKYKLGEPIAGNLFLTQYDPYVPILRKELGI